MREFVLYSRTGRTDSNFGSLMEGGRLDTVHQCILTAIFKSQAHRHDVVFHAILNGPPRPPVHIAISGNELRDARVDEKSWEGILKGVLAGKEHPGVLAERKSLQAMVHEKHGGGYAIFALSNEGKDIDSTDIPEKSLFVIGDHIGIPKKDEGFVLRYGTKLSLGRQKYLAASCIDIINYCLDRRSVPDAQP